MCYQAVLPDSYLLLSMPQLTSLFKRSAKSIDSCLNGTPFILLTTRADCPNYTSTSPGRSTVTLVILSQNGPQTVPCLSLQLYQALLVIDPNSPGTKVDGMVGQGGWSLQAAAQAERTALVEATEMPPETACCIRQQPYSIAIILSLSARPCLGAYFFLY